MKRIVIIVFCMLGGLLVQTAGAQSPPGQVGPAAVTQQQDAQSKPAQPTSPEPAKSERVNQLGQPPVPPVLRRQPQDLVEGGTPDKIAGPEDVGEGDVVRVDTTLISIPVSVMDRDGKYIPNLHKEDFRVWEDGAEQTVAYFASTEKPFTVVLMIDTSGSTRAKLQQIQSAAIAFVALLRPDDRVMVVSFSDKIKTLSRVTSDRNLLWAAIRKTEPGSGTRLFDAVDQVVNGELSSIDGRKAIVLFSDGVDTTSRRARYYNTVRDVEESGALVYPIKYDTYSDLGTVNPGAPGLHRGDLSGDGTTRAEYERADRYLRDLARVSGAHVYEANGQNLDSAFSQVAEELRRQYSVGYYPAKIPQLGDRRTIKVRVNRPALVVRTRESYIFRPKPKAKTSTRGVYTQPGLPSSTLAPSGNRLTQ